MSSKHPTNGEEGHARYGKRTWLKMLVLFCFGWLIVAVLCLLSGCSSDSKPEAVSGKKDKTAASPKAMKSKAVLPQNLGEVSGGTVKREPLYSETEVAPGLTFGELEKRMDATRKRVEAPGYEVFPGITKKELDDKIAAEQKRHESADSANQEIFPGITKKELDARMAAHVKMTGSSNAGLAGITKEELNARLDADRIMRGLNQEVMPGVFKDKLDAKLREAGKQ